MRTRRRRRYSLLCLCLLEYMERDDTAGVVILAVTQNLRQLQVTLLVAMYMVFIFSVWMFHYMQDDLKTLRIDHECDMLWTCFIATVNLGFRNGGGIGDVMKERGIEESLPQWVVYTTVFQFMFFIIINIVLLNIVFGIIVDSFGALREEKLHSAEDGANICFLCGFDRAKFDREGKGFKKHREHDHNVWHYMGYIFHILGKERHALDGMDLQVERCLTDRNAARALAFFPVTRAMVFEQQAKGADVEKAGQEESTKLAMAKMEAIEAKMDAILEKIEASAQRQDSLAAQLEGLQQQHPAAPPQLRRPGQQHGTPPPPGHAGSK